jgi:2-(1,2-epoxy-1,2-dihydrophenyl)acetyl-CoA isomerase
MSTDDPAANDSDPDQSERATRSDSLAPSAVVATLYEAMHHGDVAQLRAIMSPEFVGNACAGMPLGVAGVHVGSDAMIRDCWGRIWLDFAVQPIPGRMYETNDGTVIVHGWYRGKHRVTQQPIEAEFVHLIGVSDGLVIDLRQVTDTYPWHLATASPTEPSS